MLTNQAANNNYKTMYINSQKTPKNIWLVEYTKLLLHIFEKSTALPVRAISVTL